MRTKSLILLGAVLLATAPGFAMTQEPSSFWRVLHETFDRFDQKRSTETKVSDHHRRRQERKTLFERYGQKKEEKENSFWDFDTSKSVKQNLTDDATVTHTMCLGWCEEHNQTVGGFRWTLDWK